jgi:GPH family glycoside/pentoside/hexuronide:cation symporter
MSAPVWCARHGGYVSRVTTHQRWAYAAPAFALAFVGVPIYVFLPKFYIDVVGVNIATLGWLLLAARLFDAVTDPAVGVWSDRTRTRWGRRRPFILAASVPLAASIYFLLNPPAGQGAAWFGGWLFALFVFWTVLVVPYESLGPELSFDHHERTGILALRDGLLIAGTVVAAASPLLVGSLLELPAGNDGERAKFFWIAVAYAPLLLTLCVWCVWVVPERRANDPARTARRSVVDSWRSGLRWVRKNDAFWRLLFAFTLSTLAFNLAGSLLLFYVRYVLGSEYAEAFLVIYLLSAVICMPIWVRFSQRFGKRLTWIVGMATYCLGAAGVLSLGAGDGSIYAVLCFVTGMTFGATVAIPSSMQADVIDYDELLCGERREGLYVGMWSVGRKLAAALGVGVALPILEASGYQPNVEQGDTTKLALRVLYAGLPLLANAIAIAIAWRYPIDKQRHEQIRAEIEARRV